MSTPPSPAPELKDFPDWLSPALVKDLRRGLKLKGFSFTYLALIIALTFLLAATILASGSAAVMGFIWLPVCLVLLVVQPIRGLSAIPEERNLETLPLIQLTRLGAFKILFGKWAALAFQTGLLTVALVPYMVLGHFLGGFEFTQNVLILLLATAFSLVLTAVTVSLSVIKNAVLRSLMGIAVVGPFLISLLSGGFSIAFSGGFSFFDASSLTATLAVTVTLGAFIVYYLISSGASQIAIAGAENHSTRRRVLALAVLLLLAAVSIFGHEIESLLGAADISPFVSIPASFLTFIVVIDCLLDPAGTSIRTARQFIGKRFFAWLFAPGWPFGWLFALLCLLIYWPSSAILHGETNDDEFAAVGLASTAIALLPGALALLLPNGRERPLNAYFLAQLIFTAAATLLLIVGGISSTEGIWTLLPHSNVFYAGSEDESVSIVWSIIHLLAAFTVALSLGMHYRAKLANQISEAKLLDANPTT